MSLSIKLFDQILLDYIRTKSKFYYIGHDHFYVKILNCMT